MKETRKYLQIAFVALVVVTVYFATPAKADSIDSFVYRTCIGNLPGGLCEAGSAVDRYTWQAPSSPTPTNFCQPHCLQFDITAVVTVNRIDFGPTTITFGNIDEITYGA